ncbi:hypothetical protein SAY87_012683 [Trapa incisa]|uniref:Uncharacterized protein n=1 Tax=Trapa incisa TaxID=236973 RepID=A0AAN7GLA9_9MYRT|nr:hypothetical protein SAY87_012683 [Trapa incisa]
MVFFISTFKTDPSQPLPDFREDSSTDSPGVCAGCLGDFQPWNCLSRPDLYSNSLMMLGARENPNEKLPTVLARDLSICWGESPQYWKWIKDKKVSGANSHGETELAELIDVCWFDIRGKYDLSELDPETTYEVMFMIMIKADRSDGWDLPVKLQLVLPDGSKQEGELNLCEQPRDEWLMIPVGEITRNSGTVEFSMNETDCNRWKSGVVVKGVLIQPKKKCQ